MNLIKGNSISLLEQDLMVKDICDLICPFSAESISFIHRHFNVHTREIWLGEVPGWLAGIVLNDVPISSAE